MEMHSDRKWQSIKNIGVYTRQTDEAIIIFNPQSGETHQLNLLALDALQFMQQPATLSLLTTHICALYQAQNTDDLSNQLKSLIEQFDDLGLIHSCCE
jgi:PqqD family protein of HPr-rel-A system